MSRNDYISTNGSLNLDTIFNNIDNHTSSLADNSTELANKVNKSDLFFNVKDYGAKGDGVTNDYIALTALLATIGANQREIYLSSGTYIIGTNLTIPSNISLIFANGAMLSPNTGIIITINGGVQSNISQIFTGIGTVTGSFKVPYILPQWWGAKADSITDDTIAIQSARTVALASKGTLMFVAGIGNYRMSTPLNVTPAFNIQTFGNATLEAIGASTNGVVFGVGNYGSNFYKLPSIANFVNGIGLYLLGANLAYIEVPNIANCVSGLQIEANTDNPTALDNTIIGGTINNCTSGSGVHFKCTNNSDTIQGTIIKFNFLTVNKYSIYYDCPTSITPNWDDVLIQTEAIEGASLAGSIGIYGPNGFPPSRCLIQARTFFGGFAVADISGGGNHNTFELAFDASPEYTHINLNGVGNRIKNLGSGYSGPITGTPITASTTSGSRATFNGGVSLGANKLFVQLAVSTLAAGATQDFYIYSPFTTGYSNMLNATQHFNQPLVIQCIEDASIRVGIDGLSSANQIHIRVLAVAAVTASNQQITVEVGL